MRSACTENFVNKGSVQCMLICFVFSMYIHTVPIYIWWVRVATVESGSLALGEIILFVCIYAHIYIHSEVWVRAVVKLKLHKLACRSANETKHIQQNQFCSKTDSESEQLALVKTALITYNTKFTECPPVQNRKYHTGWHIVFNLQQR